MPRARVNELWSWFLAVVLSSFVFISFGDLMSLVISIDVLYSYLKLHSELLDFFSHYFWLAKFIAAAELL